MIYEKSCGAVVFSIQDDDLSVVVEYMARGHVSLPKGHVEAGETEEETAAREIREETNLTVRIDSTFRHEIAYSPKPGVRKTVVFFLAEADELSGLKPQEEEVAEIRVMGIDDAIREMTYETDKEVLRHAASYIARKYLRKA